VQESAEEEESIEEKRRRGPARSYPGCPGRSKDLGESISNCQETLHVGLELDQDLGKQFGSQYPTYPIQARGSSVLSDENSPIRVLPPSRRDVIFSGNPNMPALSFHVATPDFSNPEPTLFRSPLHAASDLGYGDKINLPTNVQSVTQEIIDKISESIRSLQSLVHSSRRSVRPVQPHPSNLFSRG